MLYEIFEPVLYALLSVIASLVVAALIEIRKRVLAWIDTNTTDQQQVFMEKLAKESVVYIEKIWGAGKGDEKLREAWVYLDRKLAEKGIHLDGDKLTALVEKAVDEYNERKKPPN